MGRINKTLPANRRKTALPSRWDLHTVGTTLRIERVGEVRERYGFVTSSIEPTFDGSAFAWVTGYRVNARGKRVEQISHLHCPEGERRELVHIGMVR